MESSLTVLDTATRKVGRRRVWETGRGEVEEDDFRLIYRTDELQLIPCPERHRVSYHVVTVTRSRNSPAQRRPGAPGTVAVLMRARDSK